MALDSLTKDFLSNAPAATDPYPHRRPRPVLRRAAAPLGDLPRGARRGQSTPPSRGASRPAVPGPSY
eukprot:4622276-Pyramimonas_sp.AAC.1